MRLYSNAFFSHVFKYVLMLKCLPDLIKTFLFVAVLLNSINLILWLWHHFSFSKSDVVLFDCRLLFQNLSYILYFSRLWLKHFLFFFSFILKSEYLPNIKHNGKYLDFNFDPWNVRGFWSHFEGSDIIGPRSDFTQVF